MKIRIKQCLLLFITIIMCTGCNMNTLSNSYFQSKGDKAIDYLEQKYGVKFYPNKVIAADLLSTTDKLICYADGMEPEHETVTVLMRKDGTYADNYVDFMFRGQIEEYVRPEVEKYFPEVKLYQSIQYVTEMGIQNIDINTPIEEVLASCESYDIEMMIVIPATSDQKSDIENKVKQLMEDLKQKKADFDLRVFAVQPEFYWNVDRYNESYQKLDQYSADDLSMESICVYFGNPCIFKRCQTP